jgi:hypothetical protein
MRHRPVKSRDSGLDTARRVLALLLVVVAAGGFVAAREYDQLESCQTTETRPVEGARSVETERRWEPLPPEDLLPIFLLALALLWPDLTSVELFGLGRIARRLNDQDARQNTLEAAQQRLENRVETTVSTTQSIALNFANDENYARLVDRVVELERRAGVEGEEPGPPAEPAEGTLAEFREEFRPIQPWVEVARRLNQPLFAQVLREGADSGRPSDDPRLVEADKQLIARIERPGRPFEFDEFLAWGHENALQIDAVRDTYAAGENATRESLRVATKFARMLWSDLQRRGLAATA